MVGITSGTGAGASELEGSADADRSDLVSSEMGSAGADGMASGFVGSTADLGASTSAFDC